MPEPRRASPDPEGDELPAGPVGPWLDEVRAAIAGTGEADVPCGTCTACCASAQFVHIGPDEVDALAHIPRALRFPAPGLPPGHVLLGYDERGRCPMLVEDGCSIYEHRPRTCRTYDCRVFPATGVEVEADKPLIGERARRWRFSADGPMDEVRLAALRAAARHLASPPEPLPPELAPRTATQRAVLAVEVHDAFLAEDGRGGPVVVEPPPGAVRVALTRRRRDGA